MGWSEGKSACERIRVPKTVVVAVSIKVEEATAVVEYARQY